MHPATYFDALLWTLFFWPACYYAMAYMEIDPKFPEQLPNLYKLLAISFALVILLPLVIVRAQNGSDQTVTMIQGSIVLSLLIVPGIFSGVRLRSSGFKNRAREWIVHRLATLLWINLVVACIYFGSWWLLGKYWFVLLVLFANGVLWAKSAVTQDWRKEAPLPSTLATTQISRLKRIERFGRPSFALVSTGCTMVYLLLPYSGFDWKSWAGAAGGAVLGMLIHD